MTEMYRSGSRGVGVVVSSVRVAILAACLAACGVVVTAQTALKYPPPRKGNTVDTYFGTKVPERVEKSALPSAWISCAALHFSR